MVDFLCHDSVCVLIRWGKRLVMACGGSGEGMSTWVSDHCSLLSNNCAQPVPISIHFLSHTSNYHLRNICLSLPLSFGWFRFSWKFPCQFTSRSSGSEEDDQEDSIWEPQKKVPRNRKQPASKESKQKQGRRVKKNTPRMDAVSKDLAVKEELVGGVARCGEGHCIFQMGRSCSFSLHSVGQNM